MITNVEFYLLLNVSYVLLILSVMWRSVKYVGFNKTKDNFLLIFFILIFITPFSHSIIPLRDIENGVFNLFPIKLFFYWKFLSLSIFDLMLLFLVLLNTNDLVRLCKKKIVIPLIIISLFDVFSNVMSITYDPSLLDKYFRSFNSVRAILTVLILTIFMNRLIFKIGFVKMVRFFFVLFTIYTIWTLVLMIVVPSNLTFVKYGLKFLLLDQTDTSLFLFFLPLYVVFSKFKLFGWLNYARTILSGLKTNILFLFLFFGLVVNYNLKRSYYITVLFVAVTVSVTLFIGIRESDVSIYTRTFQAEQLIKYYWKENPVFFLTGIGSSKSYKFYDNPKYYDSGAYIRGEDNVNGNYKLGFQYPFLISFKNTGILGTFLLFYWGVIFFNSTIRSTSYQNYKCFRKYYTISVPFCFAFILFSYPGVGYKQFFLVALLFTLLLNNNTYEKNIDII